MTAEVVYTQHAQLEKRSVTLDNVSNAQIIRKHSTYQLSANNQLVIHVIDLLEMQCALLAQIIKLPIHLVHIAVSIQLVQLEKEQIVLEGALLVTTMKEPLTI